MDTPTPKRARKPEPVADLVTILDAMLVRFRATQEGGER